MVRTVAVVGGGCSGALVTRELLRGGQDDESEIAGDADGGNRGGPQSADPVEIDEHVQRLKDHADQHVAGRFQEVPG